MIIGRFYYKRNSEQLEEPIPQTPKRDNPAKTKKKQSWKNRKNNPGKPEKNQSWQNPKKTILEKPKKNNPGKTKKKKTILEKQKKNTILEKQKKHQTKTFFRKSRGGGLTSGFLEDFPKIGLFGVFGGFVFGFSGFSRIVFFGFSRIGFFGFSRIGFFGFSRTGFFGLWGIGSSSWLGFSLVIESPNNYIL